MRILLAEDDTSLSHAIETILKKNNYAVDVVFNGRDALAYLESDLYDAVILDIMMPYVDGITVLKTVRKNNNHIPILLLTAKHQIEDKVEGLDAGANDYLTKPFDFRELLARLRCIMRVPEVQSSNTLRIGNVTLDDATCVLSTSLGRYQLANKEFQMMKLFMSSPGQIISAERFLEKIWDMDSTAEMNTVWTYVSYLRRKLEAISANVQISTKRNLGYALEEIK
ncbi:MAG: response regulator transcription factor [Agathobacter sp.]